jgi:putative ABC transport system substrate-binding protein
MRELGYVEGKNLVIEWRFADGEYERLPGLAAQLVQLNVDALVTHGTPGSLAAKRATTAIPIVIAAIGDPIAAGIVTSLARSGGNITGSAFFNPELMAKRLELLKEAAPRIAQVAVLMHPSNSLSRPIFESAEIAANSLKLRVHRFDARGPNEFDSAFSTMVKRRVDAVEIFDDAIFGSNAGAIAHLAIINRLPSAGSKEFGNAGGLIGYGPNIPEMYRRAAYFIDKIFKGAKPADLPIEQPTKFELVINRKTANALGITIPQSILVRADRVIE